MWVPRSGSGAPTVHRSQKNISSREWSCQFVLRRRFCQSPKFDSFSRHFCLFFKPTGILGRHLEPLEHVWKLLLRPRWHLGGLYKSLRASQRSWRLTEQPQHFLLGATMSYLRGPCSKMLLSLQQEAYFQAAERFQLGNQMLEHVREGKPFPELRGLEGFPSPPCLLVASGPAYGVP